jgi:hypothetical protein
LVLVGVYRRRLSPSPRAVYDVGHSHHLERVVWFLTSALETLLALRLGLRLLGVDLTIPPVHLLNQVTDPLVGMFDLGIFHLGTQSGLLAHTFQLEPDSLLAMMVFWLLGWVITILVGLATSGREVTR